ELLYQLNDANVTFVLTGKDIHLNDYENMQSAYKVLSFSDVMCEVETTTDLLEHIQLTDPMTIIYTSGTTGHPKGVVHTYGNHWWSAISSSLNTGLHTDDKWLAMLPIFHVGGLSIFLKSVIYGMSTFLVESFEASRVNRLIIERKITIVSVVTVMLQQLLADLEQETYPNTFRYMLLGGGSCPEQLLLEAKSKHIRVIQSYGMTETSSQIVTLAFADALKKIGSSGKPLFPAEVNILHKDADGIGEVCVKGPMVTNGYYKNERATEESFVDEWLRTGDLGYLDEDGFLYVVDRRTDLIISGGENIYPSEVEHAIMQIDGVLDVAVVGQADNKWGQVPVAFVVQVNNLKEKDILTFLKRKLATYKLPKEIIFIDELPRNASNKIMKYKLRQTDEVRRK